jgi:hypothetical protein
MEEAKPYDNMTDRPRWLAESDSFVLPLSRRANNSRRVAARIFGRPAARIGTHDGGVLALGLST